MIGPTVNPLAKDTEPASKRRVFPSKARTGADVCQIENKIVDRISFVFQRSSDRQTFAGLEEREESAASSGRSTFRDETKLAPGLGRRIRNERRQVMLQLIA